MLLWSYIPDLRFDLALSAPPPASSPQGANLLYVATYDDSELTSPRFVAGIVIFFTGMAINIQSDSILINLRKPGETGYKIPQVPRTRLLLSPDGVTVREAGGCTVAGQIERLCLPAAVCVSECE